jgi:hypothetical protein
MNKEEKKKEENSVSVVTKPNEKIPPKFGLGGN